MGRAGLYIGEEGGGERIRREKNRFERKSTHRYGGKTQNNRIGSPHDGTYR